MIAGVTYGVAKKTLGEQAYEAIREEILSLRLHPGQTVYESDFTRMLNMSRTPIREAVRALAMERLIEVLPQRGMKVALISEKQVEETRFVRESLELAVIRRVTEEAAHDEGMRARLEQELAHSLREQQAAADAGDAMRFMQADDAFHQIFLQAFENETLSAIVAQMRGHLNRVRMLSLFEPERMKRLVGEHEQVARAVLAGRPEQAVDAMHHHLSKLMDDLPRIKAHHAAFFGP
ncbi:transcriptional regulator, GntR family [Alicyclobacillus vulcanalis]|uniref:Transcriptional regulator, GntR family n=1 Tax=Alicyclobacillus vulcanalis TaxID=252246 RepID=A0A1N7MCJ9_9BACL|nr:transcriptional regulator, GntR family [Alicyclobacillus vulcanalis]